MAFMSRNEMKVTDRNAVSVCVYKNVLRSDIDHGLRKQNWLKRMVQWRERVEVEKATGGVEDNVFFAPDSAATNSERVVATNLTNIDPEEHADSIVRSGDKFTISFSGMCVTPQDTLPRNKNELFLYSILKDDEGLQTLQDAPAMHDASTQRPVESGSQVTQTHGSFSGPASELSPDPGERVLIHYDPTVDPHRDGDCPHSYVQIPSSKSLYMHSHVGDQQVNETRRNLCLRFSLFDIDVPRSILNMAISSVGEAGGLLERGSSPVPEVELFTAGLKAGAALGRKALKQYARPDHVMSVDTTFLLRHDDSDTSPEHRPLAGQRGNYLRYGYYYFLKENCPTKLYAQTGCVHSKPIFLKRTSLKNGSTPDEGLHFRLTDINYVVVEVSRNLPLNGERNYTKDKQRWSSLMHLKHNLSSGSDSRTSISGALNSVKRLIV